ncbi:unnamed protein product [Didymodactylos carnosus]|nr:unnamed protein product [Didymodactylos carnosus]CAF3853046.1 unnamed protein product [Didymodactylos carnosus]
MKFHLGQKTCGYKDKEYAYLRNKTHGIEMIQKLLDEHITPNHPEYEHCCHLLNEYAQRGTIESLLTLYTLETPFYHQLHYTINPLAFPLFMHLPDLQARYFQGTSYRGVKMTREEIREYHWALNNRNKVISTGKFASTSIDRHVAEKFASNKSSSTNKISVLLAFHFPKPCDTAIILGKVPEQQLPCISNYEDEQEILVGPRTFF